MPIESHKTAKMKTHNLFFPEQDINALILEHPHYLTKIQQTNNHVNALESASNLTKQIMEYKPHNIDQTVWLLFIIRITEIEFSKKRREV